MQIKFLEDLKRDHQHTPLRTMSIQNCQTLLLKIALSAFIVTDPKKAVGLSPKVMDFNMKYRFKVS